MFPIDNELIANIDPGAFIGNCICNEFKKVNHLRVIRIKNIFQCF